MKILIITDQFPPAHFGGMATHAYHIARYLGKRYNVMVVILRRQKGFDYTGEPFVVRPVLTKRFPRLDYLIIHHIARSFKPDAIHVCTAGLVNESLSRRYPVITRVVGNDFLHPWCGYKLPLRSMLYRIPSIRIKEIINKKEVKLRKQLVIKYLKQSKCVVANSRWTRNRLIHEGVPAEQTAIIVGGLDTNVFYPSYDKNKVRKRLGFANGQKILITAAHLVMKKNIDTVLKAIAVLLPKRPDLLYLIIGEGKDCNYFRKIVKDLKLNENTLFTGKKDQYSLSEYYQAADIYIQPSRETMGRTFLEAGACGLPVIAANVEGVPDVVQDGVNGLLVNDSKNYNEVAEKINTILADKELYDRLSAAGLRAAREKYSWTLVGNAFDEQIKKCLSKRNRTRKDEFAAKYIFTNK